MTKFLVLGRDEPLRDREIKLLFEVNDDDRNAYIQRIYTMPLYRRARMASKLLRFFEQFGKRHQRFPTFSSVFFSQELICSDCMISDSHKAGIAFLESHEYCQYDSQLLLGQTG